MGVFVVQAMNSLDFRIFEFADSSTIKNTETPNSIIAEEELSSDITYILITWKWWGNHDAPDLTDTLILMWIDSDKQNISMLSIPRDLYVEYPKTQDVGKINEIYFHGLQRWQEQAMDELTKKITEITWKNIDYYVNLDFQGFVNIVDILGGVDVTLEENFVDNNYPDGNFGYKTFILKKWSWTLDGEVALMYARSRYSTSDFDRSLRQQEIIASLKQKISQLGYFKDRKKIIELYGTVWKYIDTNIPLSEIITLALDIKSWEDTQIMSFNLNDSCFYEEDLCWTWWFLYTPLRQYFDGKSVIIPNGATYYDLGVYDEIQKFSQIIFDAPEVLSSPQEIMIYNASQTSGLANEYANMLKPYGVVSEDFSGLANLTEKKFEKSILYYNNIDSDDVRLKLIGDVLDIPSQETQTPVYSWSGTTIEIIVTDIPIVNTWSASWSIVWDGF